MDSHGHAMEGRMTSRKQSVPMMKRSVAMATKNGPAAPVSLSAQRSTRLKQAKTKRGQAPGMMHVIEKNGALFSNTVIGHGVCANVVIGSKFHRSSTTSGSPVHRPTKGGSLTVKEHAISAVVRSVENRSSLGYHLFGTHWRRKTPTRTRTRTYDPVHASAYDQSQD